MKKDLYILGAGGHGGVLKDIALKMNIFNDIFYLDDKKNKNFPNTNEDIKGDLSESTFDNINKEKSVLITAFGNNSLRSKYHKLIKDKHLELTILIHPFSSIAISTNVAEGSVICAGSIIGPNTNIGEGCIINHNSTIDHDCKLKEFVHICPQVGLAGNVVVGSFTQVGIGSSIIQNIKIGSNCIIGAGSTVINNINSDIKAYGSPAIRVN